MTRFVVVFAYLAVVVFAIIDIILMVPTRVKYLPKWAWILAVVVLPVAGLVLWFLVGRARLNATGGGARPARRGPRAPDDDPEFLGKLARDREQEERIRNLEERLRELGDDDQQRPAG